MGNVQKRYCRRDWLKLSAAALASLSEFEAAAAFASSKSASRRRVLILGIDGLSPGLLDQYAGAGRLPHFAQLMREGHFRSLRSSMPPQSPVAWSNFISGMNPGGHGIFDFIHRDPSTLAPYLSTSRTLPASFVLPVGGWRFPLRGGGVESLRRGPAFWQILSEHGVPCTLYNMPTDFPPVACDAQTISGLGTPDLLGTYGVSSYVTDVEPANRDELTDVHLTVVDMSRHRCEAYLIGPENTLREKTLPLQVPFRIDRDRSNRVARIVIQGQELLLNQGEWSDWVRVRFEMLPHVASVTGICRFFLKEVHPRFKLYVSPINIDPSNPALPISTPSDFSKSLAHEVGLFHTLGIAEDTKALSTGLLDDGDYLRQATLVLEERIRAFDYLLKNYRGGLLFFYFSSIDLNSHMYWRAMDPSHPLYTPELGEQYGTTIEELYVKMDAVLGRAMEHVDRDTTLIVLSDHGFSPFRRTFNLNSWLLESGYAALKVGARRDASKFLADTDWSRTYVYGMGINSLYLNLREREKHGILARGRQADLLLDAVAKEIADLKDPQTGLPVLANVYKAKEIYRGEHAGEAPDLVLGFHPGYRASWKTALGTYEHEVLADNQDKWSGDHCIDVNAVPGVLLSNRKITTDEPALVDLAPSILAEYGISPPPEIEGKRILQQS
ncbi:MAG: alkaline phosphatase family protein [Planctomycetota bacterium]